MRQVYRLFPALRIHSWGGFGSQLFALVMARRLLNKGKFRRILIIFHTSGVTERELEIPLKWLDGFTTKIVADYRKQHSKRLFTDNRTVSSNTRAKLKAFLLWSGLAATANSEREFQALKPWVLSLRGHYTLINLKHAEIIELTNKFELSLHTPDVKATAIHYRLGDLMTIEKKGIISPDRIFAAWEKRMNTTLPLQIFSDSPPSHFESIWRGIEKNLEYEFYSLPPIQTIKSCFQAQDFLGTNAKLSLWIAIFRSQSSSKKTLIPEEIQKQLNALLRLQDFSKSVDVY